MLFLCTPGGMYNGLLIQDLDIKDVSSERRNPILANVMAKLDYMEKRGMAAPPRNQIHFTL